jgi:hypothetical protein
VAEVDAKLKQIEITERLQLMWLEHMEKLFKDGGITSTDLATLQRFLSANGWTLDPTRIPQGLKDKLTANVDPKSFENDGDVLPFRKNA